MNGVNLMKIDDIMFIAGITFMSLICVKMLIDCICDIVYFVLDLKRMMNESKSKKMDKEDKNG